MKSTDLVDNQYLRTDMPQFGPGDEGQSRGQRGHGRGVPTGRVVIGEGDDVQPGSGGVPHQLGGRVGPVGSRGVAVQIDAHDADSRR
jgi:hypothetical protein